VQDLVARVLKGEVRAAARACRLVDDRGPGFRALLKEIYPNTRAAFWIGITGSPGAGKSTLVAAMVKHFRAAGKRVAVVAIDPSSPFSGGAILGDRVRMQQHFEDPEVFIRSLATRGALGGLSRSAVDVARVLSAWGAEVVLLETVGVGQDEFDVVFAAETSVVVLTPGMGDSVQAMKAGILECADVFALNKADLAGADRTAADLEQALALGGALNAWVPAIVRCVATQNQGIDALLAQIEQHRIWQLSSAVGRQARSERVKRNLLTHLRHEVVERALLQHAEFLSVLASAVEAGILDPYNASERLLATLLE